MTQRRYGPTLGAGVAVIEESSDKPIQEATIGVTSLIGIMEKGPINKLFRAANKTQFLKFAGSYISESLLPDSAFKFYDRSAGAGELWLKRVTDGTETTAYTILKSRHTPVRLEILKVSAGNAGRWAGKKQTVVGDYTAVSETTLSTGLTMKLNEFKGAVLTLSAVAGKSYTVVSNTTAGVLTFAPDTTLVTDLGGSPNQLYGLELLNAGKEIAILVVDGEQNPTTEFGLKVFVDGVQVKYFRDLSMDPNSTYYVERVVNDDSDEIIVVEDLNTGTVTADTRPANYYGISTVLTATVLTFNAYELQTNSPGGTVGTLASVSYGASVKKDTLTLTCTVAGPGATFSVVSALQGAQAALTEGVAYTMNEYGIDFTLNSSGPAFQIGDIVTIVVDPLEVNALAGSTLIPDYLNNRRDKFTIESNTVNTITVKTGSDMTAVATASDEFLVVAPSAMGYGYDGVDGVADTHYIQALDVSTSQLNALFGRNKGLVKIAIPGVTATAVQKAGLAYAEAKNYQFRVEVPSNILSEQAVEEYINSTIGRSDFGKVHFPSYGYVAHPSGQGMKLISLVGSILGKEARIAADNQGYQKPPAGIDVTLPEVLKLPTEDLVLDEEFLNPQGINVLKFYKGNCIIWGARTISIDPTWKFAHHRELMSHYENIFRESFDYIIFALSTVTERERAKASFIDFFLKEYSKNAIVGKTFKEAVSIKIDDEINTPDVLAAGDTNAQIKIKFVDMIERFNITVSKAGIFESLTA